MLNLTKALIDDPQFKKLLASIDGGSCPVILSGLSEIHRAHAAAAIRASTMRPIVVICSAEDEAARLAQDISSLSMEQAFTLNAREFTFHEAEVVSRQIEQTRIATLTSLLEQNAPIVVMSISGALQRTISKHQLLESSLILRKGNSHDVSELSERLILCG